MADFLPGIRFAPVLLLLAACASAPAPAPAPVASAPSPAGEKPVPRLSLICHEKATAARFDEMGVPRGERPVAVALAKDATYVLFEPARLLRITRKDGKLQAEMALGKSGESWTALDVDPADGSVWVAANDFVLRRITPDWKVQSVKLQKVEGSGGFNRLLVAGDALYAEPTCAEHGVWRIDRQGRVLATAFPAPPPDPAKGPEVVHADQIRCSPVKLERDAEGRIVALNVVEGTVHRADAQGGWTEIESSPLRAMKVSVPEATVVKGVDVGEREEQWFVSGPPRDLFYWKGRPVLLGPITTRNRGGNDTVLLVPEEPTREATRQLLESCHGAMILDVATTPERYVAINDEVIVFGDFATAPDLP